MGQSLICGSMAGLLSSSLTFPLDLVRRQLQLEGRRGAQFKFDSYAAVVRSVYRKQGFVGFYQGILPEYYKVVPGVAIAYCVYEALKRRSGVTVNKDGR
jgi:solute carrier family 25 phosphate transporter 23/24/25/41